MKIVHTSSPQDQATTLRLPLSSDWQQARQFEQEGEWEKAIKIYKRMLKTQPLNEKLYDRLMIIYRKNKNYQKEKEIINTAIRVYEKFYKENEKTTITKKVAAISKALLKSLQMTDARGRPSPQREPVKRWTKRKQWLLNRLNS
ncbi:tetratricopeptide repeat protein [Terrimonas alba]|uniref:tetratricopeptide repeat protein n=1 Tax=Terrimonas alba TaxID=3349636 RepID=UPI0035F2D0BC